MPPKLVVHVADVDIRLESGMGRVASHWRAEFERRGHEFVHIGAGAVGPLPHHSLFPFHARKRYRQMRRRADVLLVHEPASGVFVDGDTPVIVFSHGLERRAWQQRTSDARFSEGPLALKQRLSVPLLRLRHCDRGMTRGNFLLLSNEEDAAFARDFYARRADDLFVFRNGADPVARDVTREPERFTVFFNGSWIPRKGIRVLTDAARMLDQRGVAVAWLLGATQADADVIWKSWPPALRGSTRVVPTYPSTRESELLLEASAFVLPSLFEGQPLSLLQAMAAARCCITSDCCAQRDLIEHEKNGLLFPVGDAARLAELIERVYRDPLLRLRLGEAAHASVQARTWCTVSSEVADRVLTLC